MEIEGQSPMNVKKVLKEYNLTFSARLSENIAERIVDWARIKPGDTVLEIGTGLGILTKALHKKKCQVITFEKDKRLLEHMPSILDHTMNVEVIHGDFLQYDLKGLKKRFPKVKVVANLPYHISTEILFHLLNQRSWVESMTLMLQKEVVDRIVAPSGSKTYGVLSILSQLYASTEKCFNVSPACFYPVPRVHSAVVHFKTRKKIAVPAEDEQLFIQMVKIAFQQRRKMITNSLKKFAPPILFTKAVRKRKIDPKRRIETFDMKDLKKLLEAVKEATHH
jgi:16S rRNA (adenine1518-N6/adenine1519-N6)-dimethyltransferase